MRKRMQMIFQDPMSSLDPRQTIESMLFEGLVVHGMAHKAAGKAHSVSAAARRGRAFPGWPFHGTHMSFPEVNGNASGWRGRLCLSPDLIVADEPVSALDVSIQAQVSTFSTSCRTCWA